MALEAIVIVLLLIAVFVFVLPSVALSRAAAAERKADASAKELAHLRGWVQWLEQRVLELQAAQPKPMMPPLAEPPPTPAPLTQRQIEAPSAPQQDAPQAPIAAPPAYVPAPSPVTAVPADIPAVAAAAASAAEAPPAPAATPPTFPTPPGPPVAPPPPPAPPRVRFDIESVIGVRLFAWLGGGAAFLGAALFLQYSIVHNLISPAMRVLIGLAAGLTAFVGGDFVRRKADLSGSALSGAGAAILYASLYAARTLYQLIPTSLAFVGMIAVTVAAGTMAVKRGALVLAVLGLLGGFTTPYLLSTGENRPLPLFAYVALLDVGVMVVGLRRRWGLLHLLAVAGSAVLFWGWKVTYLDAGQAPLALFIATALGAVFIGALPYTDVAPTENEIAQAQTPDLSLTTGGPQLAALLGAILPLLVAFEIGSARQYSISPAALVLDLSALVVGTFFVARRSAFSWLLIVTAALSALALVVRIDRDLFPALRIPTLAMFLAVPAELFAAWLVFRGQALAPPSAANASRARASRAAALVAIASGFVVVVAVSTLESSYDSITPICVYVAFFVVALVAMGGLDRSGGYLVAAQGFSVGVHFVLAMRFRSENLTLYTISLACFGLGLFAVPLLGDRYRRSRFGWGASATSPLTHGLLFYALAESAYGSTRLGVVTLLLAAVALGMASFARARLRDDEQVALAAETLESGLAVVLVTAAAAMLLRNEWITIAWSCEVAALGLLYARRARASFVAGALILGALVFVRLVANPEVFHYYPRSGTPVFNYYLYTYGIPTLALLGAAVAIDRNLAAPRVWASRSLRIAAGLVFFVLLNVEIADFYSTGDHLTLQYSGGTLAQDMTASLTWGLYALGLLAFGVLRASRGARLGGIAVLLLTIAKVFLHDLWSLGALYRVGSIIGLAFALLVVSFVTQRLLGASGAKEGEGTKPPGR